MHVKSAETASLANPARPARCKKLNVAVDFRRVEQSESCRIELQKTGPPGAQVEVSHVEANAGFIVLANSDGKRPSDGAVAQTERGGEKLAHIGPAPAIVDPVLLLLCFRFAGCNCVEGGRQRGAGVSPALLGGAS